jgi:hypothetical protein
LIGDSCRRQFRIVEAFAAFVTVGTGTLAAGQEVRLGSAAVEAVIEAGLVAQTDVRQTHAAGWAVVVGTAKRVRWDGWQRRAAVQAMFGGSRVGCKIVMRDSWFVRRSNLTRNVFARRMSEPRGLGSFGAARAW